MCRWLQRARQVGERCDMGGGARPTKFSKLALPVDGNADLSGKVWILKRIREMEAIDAIIPQNLMLARLFFFS
jgi:hypothetical protein